ncbi:hypothetical protein BC941DRAFT_490175 [Chlamydoabsidia padenii]|nr:hypothetical protein BC941DRAFT_490175 [Chlamydoabsidia padenii]
MKFNLIVCFITAFVTQCILAAPITDLPSEPTMVSDLVTDGWPQDQADIIVSLFDAVDALADVPERDEEDSDEVRYFDNLRVDLSQLLAQAGYAYTSVGARHRVISRLADTPVSGASRRDTMIHVLHEVVSLVHSANLFIGMLDNPTLSEFGSILLDAAQMVEKLVNFPNTPQ